MNTLREILRTKLFSFFHFLSIFMFFFICFHLNTLAGSVWACTTTGNYFICRKRRRQIKCSPSNCCQLFTICLAFIFDGVVFPLWFVSHLCLLITWNVEMRAINTCMNENRRAKSKTWTTFVTKIYDVVEIKIWKHNEHLEEEEGKAIEYVTWRTGAHLRQRNNIAE